MKTSTVIWIIVIILIIAGGIYWFASQSMSMPSSAPQTTATAPASAAPTLSLGSTTQFPSYLTASNGMALYTYNKDASGVSNCSGSCATIWPPYTVSSASGLSVGANIPGTISTITRSDGTLQVTYNGMPLYFFAQDAAPGDVTGNGEGGFAVAMAAAGGVTVQPQAAAQVTAPAAAPAPSTAPAYNY